MQVSRSGYYAAYGRQPSKRQCEDLLLRSKIGELHEEHYQAIGVIKTCKLLQNEGIACGRNRVARLRKEAGIETRRTRQHKRTREHRERLKNELAVPDLVKRRFKMTIPNQVWVGDMTQIPTRKGPVYLAMFKDLCTHSITGWAMSTNQTAALGIEALQAGLDKYRPLRGLVCHTDQGAQYSSTVFRDALRGNGILPSMSRRGNCHDNAVAESFFSNLKNELTHHTAFEDPEAARAAVSQYINVYYNTKRLHQGLGYKTPAQAEASHRCT